MVQPELGAVRAVAAPQRDLAPLAPPEGFEDFYRSSYPKVVKAVMLAGATLEEARDAASEALTDMLRIWPVPGSPLGYACTAAIRYFIKARTRGSGRVARRLVERGHVKCQEGAEDPMLGDWEDREWVASTLGELTPAQREVMQCIADGLGRDEIEETLGISRVAIRTRLKDARARLLEVLAKDGELRRPRLPAGLESR